MRLTKLSRNVRPQEQKEGTYPFGKNGVKNYLQGTTVNEKGFYNTETQAPYTVHGVIETDRYPILFSTDNVNSAIGFFNTDSNTYVPILNDASLGFLLGFSLDYPITGQVQRNYKGELVGAFTDKNINPFYLNFDNPQVDELKDMLLFPSATNPVVNLALTTGGVLLPGAYYVAIGLAKLDGTETAYLTISSPIIIKGTAGETTDQAIEITLASLDPAYEQVRVAIIYKNNGVTKAVQYLNNQSAASASVVLYTGNELTEDITLEEILIAPAYYKKVGNIGQLNDSLYLVDLESAPEIRMQKYANLVRIKWHSTLVNVSPVDEDIANGKKKGVMHDEVMALYIRYSLTAGGYTKAFTVPGRPPASGDTDASSTAAGEGVTALRYQVEDRINTFSVTDKSGYCGAYLNATEVYPDTADFDSTGVGGENLRATPVRHHKFPSISWCKEHLYAGNVAYGRSTLDMLGVSAENIIIPAEYAALINGYEILYAKRSVNNSTVLGQSLLLYNSRSKWEPTAVTHYATGGNWNSEIAFKKTERQSLLLDQTSFRLHPFDALFNKPDLSSAAYLSVQLKHRVLNLSAKDSYIEDGAVDGAENNGPLVYKIDYEQKGSAPVTMANKIKGVSDVQIVPNHAQVGNYQNLGVETAYVGKITHPEDLIPSGEVSWSRWNPNSVKTYTPPESAAQFETTFLTNLKAVRQNVYVPFTGQSLVRMGRANLGDSIIFYGGDVYISDYSFHTYGWWVSDQGQTSEDWFKGTKVVRRFICETVSNLYSRYEEAANTYSKFYPKSSLAYQDKNNYLTNFIRTNDPNQFGYSKDSNALDDLISTGIFDTFADSVTTHIHRIHRGGKFSKQTKLRSWRTFLPLDYYELQKNMGRPIRVEGMDDRLLIHCENALLLTQDKAKLESDIIAITLGSGDIFQFQPQEGLSSKQGYAGTQHELATIRTPDGYIFIDSKSGQVFLYKGTLKLITDDMSLFFEEFARLKETNVFVGNGYTIGYDPDVKHRRFLLTAKNKKMTNGTVPTIFNPSAVGELSVGAIIIKNGRIQRFLGVNDTEVSGLTCPEDLVPLVNDVTFTIPEDYAVGNIGVITGTDVDNVYMDGVAPFSLLPNGELYLTTAGVLDYFERDVYIFTGIAANNNGHTSTFTITINITLVNQTPVAYDQEVHITDGYANGDQVCQVEAMDRETDTLDYNIIDGDVEGLFEIDHLTGMITILDNTTLDGLKNPVYVLTIEVNDGLSETFCTITVYVSHDNKAPIPVGDIISILDSTLDNTVVYTIDTEGWDLEGDDLTLTLINQSVPEIFDFNPVTGEIKLLLNSSLDPAANAAYILTFSVTDAYHVPVLFNIQINVFYDRASIAFIPSSAVCTSGPSTCPSGWTLSDDGTACTRLTSAAPDVIGGGVSTLLEHFSLDQYSKWGTIIYPVGTYGSDGAPSVKADTSLILSTSPLFAYKPGGESVYTSGIWANATLGVAQDGSCGRLNDTGVWKQGDQTYVGSLGFSRQINIPAAGNYLIGIGSDNAATLSVNGTAIVTQNLTNINTAFDTLYSAGVAGSADLFRYWHVYQVTLVAGINIITVSGNNISGQGIIGVEVYNCSIATLKAANTMGALTPYILFSSAAPSVGSVSNGDASDIGLYDCSSNPGYVLAYDPGTSAFYCKLVESTASTPGDPNTRSWEEVIIQDTRHTTTIDTVPNDIETYFQGDILIPYYPPVADHIDCGGSITTYLSVEKSTDAQKLDCEAGIGSVVRYTVPAGSYMDTTLAAANASAQAEADALAQTYANVNGKCN